MPMALYLIDLDGSNVTRVAQTFGAPSWAPDGLELAFTSVDEAGERGIYAVRPDSTDLRLIVRHDASLISWSPNGSELLLFSGAVHLVRPDGTGLRQLGFSHRQLEAILASWSPDGARIVVHFRPRSFLLARRPPGVQHEPRRSRSTPDCPEGTQHP